MSIQKGVLLSSNEVVSDKIITLANVITFIRLCLTPVALLILLSGHDVFAAIFFGVIAATDFVDGKIARKTNTVSKVGQLLDPAVDRLLMICAVVGLLILGRIPLWIVVVVLLRDALLLIGGSVLLKKYNIRVPVVYAGKVATTLLFVGFAGMILNMPLIDGLGITTYEWLPGFNSVPTSWGIWFIYAGLLLSLGTTIFYLIKAYQALRNRLNEDIHEPIQ